MLGCLSLYTHLMLGFLSLNTHLFHSRPLVALLVFLPLFWVPVFSADSQYEACGAYDCGAIRVSYPFTVDYRRPEFCTNMGLNLTCIDNTPLLNLTNQLYQVRYIDYQTSTIFVVAQSIIDSMECPYPKHNVTLDNYPFNYSTGVMTLLAYMDCPASLRSWPTAIQVPCLGNSFAMFYGLSIDYPRCRFLVEVPVLERFALRHSSDSLWRRVSVCHGLQMGAHHAWSRVAGADIIRARQDSCVSVRTGLILTHVLHLIPVSPSLTHSLHCLS
ncbi:hypothetical protein AMTR_s00213p00033130 [Amborella trichopoda]|uniref:Wall-associated receptor kinase galacturonan-binding domain-containing protein n=1 Tax=Amborella trichopoda TaxID=13333 RepID=W1P3H9_AMBTC|nr:hypothetical protein AMTR_s00213p00033130 [Amborella trichopoda]